MITLKEKIQDLLYGSFIRDDHIYRWEAEKILKLVTKQKRSERKEGKKLNMPKNKKFKRGSAREAKSIQHTKREKAKRNASKG